MKKYINKCIATLVAGVLTITSCTDERETFTPPGPGGNESEITCMIELPQTMKVATRSETGSVAENKINDIHVLVFNKTTGNLISKSKGKNLVAGGTNENNVTFKATLPVGTEYTFMVLANTGNKLDGINVGASPAKDKTDVLALTINETGKWSSSASIPMWGEQNMTLTGSSTPTFELTRLLARINVELNLPEVSPGVSIDNFQLTSIHYYNYNTAGALVPDVDNYNQAGKYFTIPTIPSLPGTQGGALVYDETYILNKKECKDQIYIFEAAHNGKTYNEPANNNEWIKNPCLVIGGKYKTADGTWLEETFYRVDFIRKDNTDPSNIKDVWLSIVRNFSYNVVITDVSGSGFPDPDTALESAPINLKANILDWNESGMGEIVFDGTFYLSVSRDQIPVGRAAVNDKKEENILYVKTDYIHLNNPAHTNSGWYVEKYVDAADGTTPVTWLKLNPEKGAPNDRVEAYITHQANNTNANRTAIVWIAAGRLRYPIYVTQTVYSIEIVDPNDNDTPLSELRFEVPVNGSFAETKQFKVLWAPASESVAIQQDSRYLWAPFEPDWLSPDPSLSWTLTGSGSQTYTVTAPGVDPSIIAQDPFYEKESTYSFTIGTGSDATTQSITLHQVHYNLIVDTYTYHLDGGTYHLSVRSNTEWEIDNIEEWLYNNPPASTDPKPTFLELKPADDLRIGRTGGPNLSGESISFTLVDQKKPQHEGKRGTVYVTFKSPTNKFPPVRVGFSFVAPETTILCLGYAKDVRAYNGAFPYWEHQQGINRMLNAKVNFGDTPASTVQVSYLSVVGYNCENTSRTTVPPQSPLSDWNKGDLKKWLNQHNPDIITMCYSMKLDADEAKLIHQYLDNGGVVLMHYGEGTVQIKSDLDIFLNEIFGTTFPITTHNVGTIGGGNGGGDYGAVYKLPDGDTFVNDPILNGPFGDVRGDIWGMNRIFYSIDLSSVSDQLINYTGTALNKQWNSSNPLYPYSVFRLKNKNLFFVANGGGTGSYMPENNNSPEFDVIRNDTDFRPTHRHLFGPHGSNVNTQRYSVCNAIMYMNAIAWGMNVSNHNPPPGGY